MKLVECAANVKTILDEAEAAGLDPAGLCSAAAIDVSALTNPMASVPWSWFRDVASLAIAETGDDSFGVRAGSRPTIKPGLGVPGLALLAKPTIGDAVQVSCEVVGRLSNVVELEVRRANGRGLAVVRLPRPTLQGIEPLVDFYLAMFTGNTRAYATPGWKPTTVNVQHAPPRSLRRWKEHFACRVRFGCAANEVEMEEAILDTPLIGADPQAEPLLGAVLDRELSSRPVLDNPLALIHGAIARALEEDALTIDAVADRLGLRRRTLQLHLQQHGLSFRGIVEEVRRARALELLVAQPPLPISVVATNLGYQAPTSFHRAFRRWTGQTPQEYRASHKTPTK